MPEFKENSEVKRGPNVLHCFPPPQTNFIATKQIRILNNCDDENWSKKHRKMRARQFASGWSMQPYPSLHSTMSTTPMLASHCGTEAT